MKIHYIVFIFLFICSNRFAQTVTERFQKTQPQDLSVPPPPAIAFPASYPDGNKVLIKDLKKMLDENFQFQTSEKFQTVIIFKISKDGEVLNISTYGKSESFNAALEAASKTLNLNKVWKNGKNVKGQPVIDIVRIPFTYLKKY